MGKLINQLVSATITMNIPIKKRIPVAGFTPNMGALLLSLGDRNFILDSALTNFKNQQRKGGHLTFETSLLVDLDTFEKGEEYNYKLSEADLLKAGLVGDFYFSDEDDYLDMSKAVINCVVTVNGYNYPLVLTIND